MRLRRAAALLAFACTVVVLAQPVPASIGEDPRFDAAWRLVAERYWDLTQAAVDWDEARVRFGMRPNDTDDAVDRGLEELYEALGDDHSRYVPASRVESMREELGDLPCVGVFGAAPWDAVRAQGANLAALRLADAPDELRSSGPVAYGRYPDGLGYLRVADLVRAGTAEGMRRAVEELEAQGAAGLILDLRGNPGGRLVTMMQAAGVFTRGFLWRALTRWSLPLPYPALGSPATELPLVVLIDGDVNSAAEGLAGALQANGRAQVVGATSAGNVEAVLPFCLRDGAQAWLATGVLAPLRGATWEGRGVEPDLAVDPEAAVTTARALLRNLRPAPVNLSATPAAIAPGHGVALATRTLLPGPRPTPTSWVPGASVARRPRRGRRRGAHRASRVDRRPPRSGPSRGSVTHAHVDHVGASPPPSRASASRRSWPTRCARRGSRTARRRSPSRAVAGSWPAARSSTSSRPRARLRPPRVRGRGGPAARWSPATWSAGSAVRTGSVPDGDVAAYLASLERAAAGGPTASPRAMARAATMRRPSSTKPGSTGWRARQPSGPRSPGARRASTRSASASRRAGPELADLADRCRPPTCEAHAGDPRRSRRRRTRTTVRAPLHRRPTASRRRAQRAAPHGARRAWPRSGAALGRGRQRVEHRIASVDAGHARATTSGTGRMGRCQTRRGAPRSWRAPSRAAASRPTAGAGTPRPRSRARSPRIRASVASSSTRTARQRHRRRIAPERYQPLEVRGRSTSTAFDRVATVAGKSNGAGGRRAVRPGTRWRCGPRRRRAARPHRGARGRRRGRRGRPTGRRRRRRGWTPACANCASPHAWKDACGSQRPRLMLFALVSGRSASSGSRKAS